MAENNERKFKVGDKVRVLSYTYGKECIYIGSIGEVVDVTLNESLVIAVRFSKPNGEYEGAWWFQEKDLELIEGDTPVTPHADPVNHPSHYNQSSIECIDAIEAATNGLDGFEGHCTGTSMKYTWRWKFKNGTEDIRKSIWYLEKLLKYEEAKENK